MTTRELPNPKPSMQQSINTFWSLVEYYIRKGFSQAVAEAEALRQMPKPVQDWHKHLH